jgi:hypothetical protein
MAGGFHDETSAVLLCYLLACLCLRDVGDPPILRRRQESPWRSLPVVCHWTWTPQSKSSLPAGISISDEGLVSGTPTLAGDYKVLVTVADAGSPPSQISVPYTIGIAGPLAVAITSSNPPGGTAGVEYGPSKTEDLSCRWSRYWDGIWFALRAPALPCANLFHLAGSAGL